ncbi:MAG: putative dsRNA-binding protein, partial [Candidatus Delongbacteria bacterium]|nr:putative dsRNA-binding protein [Candidatus Delongbacteria bacterium]
TILENFEDVLADKKNSNHKSELLELVQSHGFEPPTYEISKEEGPEHDKTFTINVIINNKIIAEGRSSSKKRAEQEASSNALKKINNNPNYFS